MSCLDFPGPMHECNTPRFSILMCDLIPAHSIVGSFSHDIPGIVSTMVQYMYSIYYKI